MNSVYGKGPVAFNDIECRGTPTGFGPGALPELTYYVKKEGGSDGNNGRSWKAALATYQAGVTLATRAENRYKDVDLIIAPAEYDEEVELSGIAQGQYQASTWYGWRMGRLRVIAMGEKVILKNSTLAASFTLNIGRMKVELHGGTFRNYTSSGHISGIHWERELYAYASDVKGDVIGGAMYGCRVEGRTAKVGIHFDGACYVWVEDCWISGWETGVLESANNLGYPLENYLKNCRFRDNTNDVLIGGSTFFTIEECKFLDDGATKFVSASAYVGHTGACSDGVMVNCAINGANLSQGKTDKTGMEYIGTKVLDI